MKEFCVFMLIVAFAHSGISQELAQEPLPKTQPVSFELDDDDIIDFTNTREVRTGIRTIIHTAIASSDPLHVKNVTANLVTLKYTVTNVNVLHISKCSLMSYKMNLDIMELNMHIHCPRLMLVGQYETAGLLIIMRVEGKGDFVTNAENYDFFVKSKLKPITDKKGIDHMKIQNFTLEIDTGGPVKFKFSNLFYGNEVASAEAHKFANSNWRPVAQLIQDPILNEIMRVFLKNANKLLKPVAIKDIEY